MMISMRRGLTIGFLLAALANAATAQIPPTASIDEANVYHCRTEVHGGNEYTICSKIGTTGPTVTAAGLVELHAAAEAARSQLPVIPNATWWDGQGMTEYCRGSVHGDCSGACRITAVLPDGSVIVECGEREELPPLENLSSSVTTEYCSGSTHGDCSERCYYVYDNSHPEPIVRIVCGDDR